MGQASDYRKRAEECIEIARTAQTPSQRIMLLHIRDTWLRLAKEAEERKGVHTSNGTVRRPPTLM